MFPKQHRIRAHDWRVRKKVIKKPCHPFLLHVWRCEGEGSVAVVVSKKVAKRSVLRHRLKRVLLHALRSAFVPPRGYCIAIYLKEADEAVIKNTLPELASCLREVIHTLSTQKTAQ